MTNFIDTCIDLGNGFAEILREWVVTILDIRDLEKEMSEDWMKEFTRLMCEGIND